MPARNNTGPMGEGPLTGRGMGTCNPNQTGTPRTNFGRFGFGRGGGRGFGRGNFGGFGRGFGRGFGFFQTYSNVPTQSEAEVLKNQASALEESLSQIKKRLDELEK